MEEENKKLEEIDESEEIEEESEETEVNTEDTKKNAVGVEENEEILPKTNPKFLYFCAAFIAIVAIIILICDNRKMKNGELPNPDNTSISASPAQDSANN